MNREKVTPGSLERFLKEAHSRKLFGEQVRSFFLQYFNIDSHTDLEKKELALANKKLAQYRYPTLDGSEPDMVKSNDQDSFLSKGTAN